MEDQDTMISYCERIFNEHQRRQFLNDNSRVLKILSNGSVWDFNKHKVTHHVAAFL